jgi:hypothetical protein
MRAEQRLSTPVSRPNRPKLRPSSMPPLIKRDIQRFLKKLKRRTDARTLMCE